jgi:hypothetical protein
MWGSPYSLKRVGGAIVGPYYSDCFLSGTFVKISENRRRKEPYSLIAGTRTFPFPFPFPFLIRREGKGRVVDIREPFRLIIPYYSMGII